MTAEAFWGGGSSLIHPDLTDDVLDEVAEERELQDARWGEQNHPDFDGPFGPEFEQPVANEFFRDMADKYKKLNKGGHLDWAGILLEEVYEALAEPGTAGLRREELIQVAAVAVAWVEAIDRREC